jgi:SAM-dependent methyltransferase
MEQVEYELMSQAEDRMWWYRAVHDRMLLLLRRAAPPGGARLLDAGCGTGGLLRLLPNAVGLDLAPVAAAFARAKSGAPVAVGSVAALPFPTASFDAVFSVDVLYHRAVDERATLAEALRCLKPGGALMLNLPAYEWLKSPHDAAVHGARRYTARRVRALLREAGFQPVRVGYWNTLLFPLMVVRRKLFPPDDAASDVMVYPAPMETAFRAVTRIEHWLLAAGLNLPFGGSVIALARKPA